MTDEFKLPEYSEQDVRDIWFEDHDDFERVGVINLEDSTRWGHSASCVVKHKASGTFWQLTADVTSGDEGGTEVDDDMTRVWPHEVTRIEYLPKPPVTAGSSPSST